MPALGSNSKLNIWSSIYQLVIKLLAYWRNHSVGWTVGVVQSLSGWVVVRYERLVAIVVKHKACLSVGR